MGSQLTAEGTPNNLLLRFSGFVCMLGVARGGRAKSGKVLSNESEQSLPTPPDKEVLAKALGGRLWSTAPNTEASHGGTWARNAAVRASKASQGACLPDGISLWSLQCTDCAPI